MCRDNYTSEIVSKHQRVLDLLDSGSADARELREACDELLSQIESDYSRVIEDFLFGKVLSIHFATLESSESETDPQYDIDKVVLNFTLPVPDIEQERSHRYFNTERVVHETLTDKIDQTLFVVSVWDSLQEGAVSMEAVIYL